MSPLPRARESLLRLQAARIPFIFVTNGGGELEAIKAEKLSRALGLPIDPRQLCLAHTPLRAAVAAHAHERILVLGCLRVADVARSYGARRVVEYGDLARADSRVYPFIDFGAPVPLPAADREEPFGAVFVLYDPNNWGAELQIALDVLRGGSPLGSGAGQAVPLYVANPDLVFAGQYPVPRIAAGAFVRCLDLLFRDITGAPLAMTQCGKPTRMTFDFAAALLAAWQQQLSGGGGGGGSQHLPAAAPPSPPAAFDEIYHIGDNPAADVRGALNAGDPWRSVLVRTGIFSGENDELHPAHLVVDGVGDAVDHIMRRAE